MLARSAIFVTSVKGCKLVEEGASLRAAVGCNGAGDHKQRQFSLEKVDLTQCVATSAIGGVGLQKAFVGLPTDFTVQMQAWRGLQLSAVLRSESHDVMVRAEVGWWHVRGVLHGARGDAGAR